jgi:hypothetical protein
MAISHKFYGARIVDMYREDSRKDSLMLHELLLLESILFGTELLSSMFLSSRLMREKRIYSMYNRNRHRHQV